MATKLYSPLANGSSTSGLAPSLSTHQTRDTDIELASWNERSSIASLNNVRTESEPPAYSESTRFTPTLQLQIQTPGKAAISLPVPPRPDPVPVFAVGSDGTILDAQAPAYISFRPTRGSGSCFLVAGDDAEQAPLSTTTYRFGPGRPPRVTLLSNRSVLPIGEEAGSSSMVGNVDQGEEAADAASWDSFELTSRSLLSRAVRFRTRLGTFEWRYASRKERKAVGADSLLVLDRVVRIFNSATAPGAHEKEEEVRTPVAQLLRNAEYRSPGSRPSSAGNGGRLLVDLNPWQDAKEDTDMVRIMVVTTCVAMLKKEIDRRRAQQIAVMAAVASGGGS